jgi:hypothetical protein
VLRIRVNPIDANVRKGSQAKTVKVTAYLPDVFL